MFEKYGLKAHLEITHVAHSWTPGISTAVLLRPWHKVIPIAAEGWSRATSGGAGHYAPADIPTATLGHDDYSLLYRMIHDYAYLAVQAEAHYREEHHSQMDTFEMVGPKQANQGAAVLAAWLWNVSQLDTPFPHHQPDSHSMY